MDSSRYPEDDIDFDEESSSFSELDLDEEEF
jgi:hypothetical protein